MVEIPTDKCILSADLIMPTSCWKMDEDHVKIECDNQNIVLWHGPLSKRNSLRRIWARKYMVLLYTDGEYRLVWYNKKPLRIKLTKNLIIPEPTKSHDMNTKMLKCPDEDDEMEKKSVHRYWHLNVSKRIF